MGSNATLVTLSSCFPMKLRGPKNKNLYDTIKRSIQFIRVTRSVSIVDCQQSFFVSLVDLVSERKLGRAEVSFALADFCSPQFPLANEIDAGKKEALIAVFLKKLWCLGDGEGKQKKLVSNKLIRSEFFIVRGQRS